MPHYTIQEVKSKVRGSYRYWAGILYIDFLAVRITWLAANYTRITPNQVTIFQFLLRLVAFFAFCIGTDGSLITGAVFYQISIILDDVDGKLARLQHKTSKFGKYLDHIFDAIGDFCCIGALIYHQIPVQKNLWWTAFAMLLPFLYLFVAYESLLFKDAIVTGNDRRIANQGLEGQIKQHEKRTYLGIFNGIKKISKRFQVSIISVDMADIAILFFVIGPLVGHVKACLLIGMILIFERILIEKIIIFIRRDRVSFI